jgi:hypothetical protein
VSDDPEETELCIPVRMQHKLYVDGELVADRWVSVPTDESWRVAEEQANMAITADTYGKKWMAEVYMPTEPEGRQYQRFGTDTKRIGAAYPVPEWLKDRLTPDGAEAESPPTADVPAPLPAPTTGEAAPS